MFIADFHIHSRYSRATSKDCVPEMLDLWARRKGLDVIGTGDFTHPAWRAELAEKLVEAEEGLYTLADGLSLSDPAATGEKPRFILSAEISSIYKKNGRVRKVHNVILLPSLQAARTLSERLEAIGNLHSDGRPILGLDSRDLLEITLEACPQAMLIPAHIWTPHFSLFGAYSGFDDIHECFGDLTEHITALETGLSSDPPMNWRLSALDRYAMVSNSDAHSPQNLAREANLFDTRLSYPAIMEALAAGGRDGAFCGTLEFFPEEGKYHFDGHRHCGVCLSPVETEALSGVCPSCGGRITVGVYSRVQALADRPEGFRPKDARPFESLVPLHEVIAASMGVTTASKKVGLELENLCRRIGPELFILRAAPMEDIERAAGPLVAEGIRRLRTGRVAVMPGYDGEYGKITLLTQGDRERLSGQINLLPEIQATPTKPKGSAAKAPAKAKAASPAAQHKSEGLNLAQQDAAASVDAVLAVVAGPGTGKTRTLVSRIAHLLSTGVPPKDIAAVTFTRKAALEMRERLEGMLGGVKRLSGMTIGTFHAICLGLLREWEGQAPVILGEADAAILMEDVLRDLGIRGSAREMLSALSLQKNGATARGGPEVPPEAAQAYAARMEALGVMDYDDILLRVLARYRQNEALPGPFAHLLADELQDVSPVQYKLLRAWARGGKSLFAIGDPDQSIYGFRGADAGCFARLLSDYPDAVRITLTENYRSTPQVLACAKAVLPERPEGEREALTAMRPDGSPVRVLEAADSYGEAQWIAGEIGRLVGGIDMLGAHADKPRKDRRRSVHEGLGFADMAALYRTNRQAAALEEVFAREGIPYVVYGRDDFLSDARVRGALAFFRVLADPGDLISLRLCLREAGYDAAGAGALLDAYREGPMDIETLAALLAQHPPRTIRGGLSLDALLGRYEPLVSRKMPAELVEGWIGDQALAGAAPMELLRNTAMMYRSMGELLQVLAFGQEGDIMRSGGRRYSLDAVSLMSLHAAKGLEFPAVFLCGVSEGLIPFIPKGGMADEAEERRLLYVGMTRAKDSLYVLHGKQPSPFLAALPGDAAVREAAQARKRAAQGKQISLFEGL